MRPEQSGRVDWPICRPLGAARRQVVSRQPRWRRLDLVVVQLPGRWRPIAGNRSKVPIPICENGWPTGPDGCELAGEILSVRRALGSTVHLAAGGGEGRCPFRATSCVHYTVASATCRRRTRRPMSNETDADRRAVLAVDV